LIIKYRIEAIRIKRLRLPSVEQIGTGKYAKSQYLFLFDAIVTNSAIVLTSGIFLSGYIVYLKGSDFITGLLNSSLTWSSIIALLSIIVFEKLKKRKTILITLNAISRLLVCSIIFLPLISKNNTAVLYTAVAMVLVGNMIYGFYSLCMTVWMIDLLPKDARNNYIFTRTFWLRISFTLTTIVMGFLLDFFNKSYLGFLAVFSLSLVLSIIDIIILIKIEEPPCEYDKRPALTLPKFFEPLTNSTYRSFLVFMLLFYITLNMSASYTPLYMIKYLGFDYSLISTATVLNYIMMIVSTKFWGKIQAKKGQIFVLRITAVLVLFEFLFNSFLRSDTPAFLVLGLLFSGIGYGGFNVSIFAYRYEIIPTNNRTIYEGWYCAIVGVGFLSAPLIGNILMRNMPVIENAVYQHSSFQLLYLLSFLTCAITVLFTFYIPSKISLAGYQKTKKRIRTKL
jgi:MFS family permease